MRLHRSLLAALAGLLVAAPAAAADCPGADLQPSAVNLAEVRTAVACLTNQERAAAGLPALAVDARLESAGQAFAMRMVAEHFFSHVGPDGSQLAGRLAAYTDRRAIGENIAWGEGSLATARKTVTAWMESPGHRANMLSATYRELGVGVAPGSPGGSSMPAATYVVDYGARFDDAPASQPLVAVAPVAAARPATAPRRPAGTKPAVRCRRGTVRRAARHKGKRIVRCVRVARRG